MSSPLMESHGSGETVGLPSHGPIHCRKCWGGTSENILTTPDGRFRVVNDPGAWGSSDPEVLVLGISKGFTQAREFARGEFDSVPFKNCRQRLKAILVSVGLMNAGTNIDAAMTAAESRYAWGSVVRCSLSGWNASKGAFGAGTPQVLPAFKHQDARRFLDGCTRRFLAELPRRTKVVCLLGNDDRYIETLAAVLNGMHKGQYQRVNPVVHRVGGTLWVHVAHPSPGNGYFSAFLNDPASSGQGRKRHLAQTAIQAS